MLSLFRSSTVVVDSCQLMDVKILLGDRELVPSEIEYCCSRVSRLMDEKDRERVPSGVRVR